MLKQEILASLSQRRPLNKMTPTLLQTAPFPSHLRQIPRPNFPSLFRPSRNQTTSVKRHRLSRLPCLTVRASTKPQPPPHANDGSLILIGSSATTVALAVANRVLYKLALVPMKHFPFFLAQFSTSGYVVIYFWMLYVRYRAGIVTDEMLAIPKWRFVAIGLLEALGIAAGMSSAAVLPGPAIPILSQTFLVWQLAFSALLLGRTYSFNQLTGCLLVAVGVVMAVGSGSSTNQMLSRVEFIWPALMILSSAFQAGGSIIKEYVFVNAAKRLKSLDIFVVNSFGSGFQALFVLLLLPFLSSLLDTATFLYEKRCRLFN